MTNKPVEELTIAEMYEELDRAIEVINAAIEYGTIHEGFKDYTNVLKTHIECVKTAYMQYGMDFMTEFLNATR